VKFRKDLSKEERRFYGLMSGIPTVYFVILYLLPCLAGLFFSLTNFGGYSLSFKMVGLMNYRRLLADRVFWKSVLNYLKLYFGTVLLCFPLSYGTAVLLTKNRRLKERALYRVLFFFPVTVPTLIIAILWMIVYNPSFGVLNTVLAKVGWEPVQWLGSSKVVMLSVILIVVWRQFGFYLVYFMAGVSRVPASLYEAARLDGASEWKQTVSITVPLTWDVIRTAMVFYVISAVNLGFGTVYVLTQGGPDNASQVISSYLYYTVTKYLKFGYASAIGVAMMVVTGVMAVLLLRVMKREPYEM